MRKVSAAVIAAALVLTLLCGQALAACGDLTMKDVAIYSDSKMKSSAGVIPAGTSIEVREYGSSKTKIRVDGTDYYVDNSALLHYDITSDYVATLPRYTRVYQSADTKAEHISLNKSMKVYICMITYDWALVQSMKKGYYGYVKVDQLAKIKHR